MNGDFLQEWGSRKKPNWKKHDTNLLEIFTNHERNLEHKIMPLNPNPI